MKKRIENHEDNGKRVVLTDGNGNIVTDDEGEKIYIIESTFLMGFKNVEHITYLLRREGTNSHGQLDWDIIKCEDDDDEYFKFYLKTLKRNKKLYKWL